MALFPSTVFVSATNESRLISQPDELPRRPLRITFLTRNCMGQDGRIPLVCDHNAMNSVERSDVAHLHSIRPGCHQPRTDLSLARRVYQTQQGSPRLTLPEIRRLHPKSDGHLFPPIRPRLVDQLFQVSYGQAGVSSSFEGRVDSCGGDGRGGLAGFSRGGRCGFLSLLGCDVVHFIRSDGFSVLMMGKEATHWEKSGLRRVHPRRP